MRTTLFGTRTLPIVPAEMWRLPPAYVLRLLALAAIVTLAAGLRFANLEALGYANHYYTAAVKSMLQSWPNFFFVAAEPGGAVSVDKPPLGLWLQAMSAYFFGVNGLAVLLPEIVAGLLAVVVVYHLVRRSFGTAAGLLSALALAITPVVVATDRNNTIDSLLILTLLLAAWAFIKATESNRLRYLLLGAVLVGLGFNIKMLQAYLPLPAFYALYFLGVAERLWRKVTNLALATVVLLLVSLSWAVVVDLTPADQRPYVGSSNDNSVLSLALGYNGLQRLIGLGPGGGLRPPNRANGPFPQPGTGPDGSSSPSELSANGSLPRQDRSQNGSFPQPGAGNGSPVQPGPQGSGGGGGPGGGFPGTGQAGLLRLFTTPLSKEASWLLPFGLFSAALLLFRSRLRWPLTPGHQALVLWGGWLLTGAIFFSIAQFFHEYYLSILGAPLAVLVSIGTVELWRMGQQRPWPATGLLLAAASLTLGLQLLTAATFVSGAWWLLLAMAVFAGGAGLLIVSVARRRRRGVMAGFAGIIAALLLTPAIWSGLTTLNAGGNQALPSAYSGQSAGPAKGDGLQVNQALLDYLQSRTQAMTYLMAVPSSMQGADYVIATGRPVLYLGGFNGMDPVVTGDDLAHLVADGQLRYIYQGGGGPGPAGQSNISTWVTTHCTPVAGFETATRNFGAPPGAAGPIDNNLSSPNRDGMQGSLYDCGG
ncbi:MAG: glycosyltransferase family 39 protein [Chloroflexota bacterium]